MTARRKKLTIGVVGLIGFAVTFALWVSPLGGGRSGLARADEFFNRLSKESSYFVPGLRDDAKRHEGKRYDVKIALKKPAEAERVAAILRAAGARVAVDGCKVQAAGDLGRTSAALLADAEAVHLGRSAEIESRYGFSGREAIYWWWSAFDAIYRQYIAAEDIGGSNFASSMRTKACEPVYNFAGVSGLKPAKAIAPLACLLGFYVLYTIWFGFSIVFIFEGLGIAPQQRNKREA